MYKILSEVSIDRLSIGDKCISAIKNPGVIKNITKHFDIDYQIIEIEWDNGKDIHTGKISRQPHYLLDKVLVEVKQSSALKRI